MRRTIMVATTALLTVSLFGCGTAPGARSMHTGSPSPSAAPVPADFVAVVPGGYRGIPDAKSLSPHRSVLVAPHSFVQLDGVARARAISSEQATDLSLDSMGLTAPMRAPAGHELILAHLPETSEQPGLPTDTGDAQVAAEATVVVDGKTRTLPTKLGPDRTVIVSVSTGAPVSLRSADGGRPQELDLRTGKRTRSASPLYYPVRDAEFDTGKDALFVLGSRRTYATVHASDQYALLAPYVSDRKWARKGRAWLVVQLSFIIGPQYTTFDPDAAASVTLTLPDGTTVTGRGSGGGATQLNEPYEQGGIDLVFDVPASLRSGTLNYLPRGSFTYEGKKIGASPYDTSVHHSRFKLTPRTYS